MRRPFPAMKVGIRGTTTLERARRGGIAVGRCCGYMNVFCLRAWVQLGPGRHEGLEGCRRLLRSAVVKVGGRAVGRMDVVGVNQSVHATNMMSTSGSSCFLGSKRWSVRSSCFLTRRGGVWRSGAGGHPWPPPLRERCQSHLHSYSLADSGDHRFTQRYIPLSPKFGSRSQEGSGTLKVYPVYQSTTYRIWGGYSAFTMVSTTLQATRTLGCFF